MNELEKVRESLELATMALQEAQERLDALEQGGGSAPGAKSLQAVREDLWGVVPVRRGWPTEEDGLPAYAEDRSMQGRMARGLGSRAREMRAEAIRRNRASALAVAPVPCHDGAYH